MRLEEAPGEEGSELFQGYGCFGGFRLEIGRGLLPITKARSAGRQALS